MKILHVFHRTTIQVVITLIVITALFCQPKTITILHTNDIHASFIPHEAFWVKGNPKLLVGGFNELSFVVDSLRHVNLQLCCLMQAM